MLRLASFVFCLILVLSPSLSFAANPSETASKIIKEFGQVSVREKVADKLGNSFTAQSLLQPQAGLAKTMVDKIGVKGLDLIWQQIVDAKKQAKKATRTPHPCNPVLEVAAAGVAATPPATDGGWQKVGDIDSRNPEFNGPTYTFPKQEILAGQWLHADGKLVGGDDRIKIQSILGQATFLGQSFAGPLTLAGIQKGLPTGVGTSRMGKPTVLQAAQAFAQELRAIHGTEEMAVVVSYDARPSSRELAQEATAVLAANKIHIIFINGPTSAAATSFYVQYHREFHSVGALMVSGGIAGEDSNGVQFFGQDGAALSPSENLGSHLDKTLQAGIPWDQVIYQGFGLAEGASDVSMIEESKTYEQAGSAFAQEAVKKSLIIPSAAQNSGREIRLLLSPLYSSGLPHLQGALAAAGFRETQVLKGQNVVGDFYSRPAPSPTDPDALKGLAATMEEKGHDLAFATDAQGHLGVLISTPQGPHQLTQQELTALLIYGRLSLMVEFGRFPAEGHLLVSSDLMPIAQKMIADFPGIKIIEVNGQENWGQYLKPGAVGNSVFVGAFDTQGTLLHNAVSVRDPVGTSLALAELALYYKQRSMFFWEVLQLIL